MSTGEVRKYRVDYLLYAVAVSSKICVYAYISKGPIRLALRAPVLIYQWQSESHAHRLSGEVT